MSNPITVSHAKKLRTLRIASNKKQSEMADVLNLTQQAYSKLELAGTVFSDEIIEKISAFFDITPVEFEHPLETNNSGVIGSNNNNNANRYDTKLLDVLQNTIEMNKNLYERLIIEKDKMISFLQRNKG